MKVEFLNNVVVNGQAFKPGDVVEAGGENASYIASCVRVGHAKEIKENAKEPEKSGKK